MRQSQNSLDKLLHLRETAKEQASLILQQSIEQLRAEEQLLHELQLKREQLQQRQNGTMNQPVVRIATLQENTRYQEYLEQTIARQADQVQAAGKQMQDKLEEWIRRAQDERVLQKHRERRLALMDAEWGRVEQKELDDISAVYHQRHLK